MTTPLEYLTNEVAKEREYVEAGGEPLNQAVAIDMLRFFESRLKVAKLIDGQPNQGPKFLCYVTGDGSTNAEIVRDIEGIKKFIEIQWIGTSPDSGDDNWESVLEDLNQDPTEWGDGTRKLIWEFECGHLSVEELLW